MPLYEYECYECNHKFSFIKLPSEEEPKDCPKCKSSQLQKLFSIPQRVKGKEPFYKKRR